VPQAAPAQQPEGESVLIPNFWDRKRKLDRPEQGTIQQIRFVTESDYPPFHFLGPDGQLMGFEVDLARAICRELKVECSIQPRVWNTLGDALARGQADAIIASMRVTAEARRRYAFSSVYYRTPARFLARKDRPMAAPSAKAVAGKSVAVVTGSAHEAYLRAFFPGAEIVVQTDAAKVLEAVRSGAVDLGFADGIAIAFWLNGETSSGCCTFVGGPYTESRYFGEGAAIAVRRENPRLVQALDWALYRLAADGVYGTLYLRYFPIGFY
jgi:polar amino acid transport system substrate-binding protein